ncbi:winged helix-turn-helix transcriptional regulator [Ruegeria sp. YS9]|uniref:winged helix-turn-helix transcriptional regulator n=1 Tax=Ruegeria sp. YS9 TaxID=2966453 RepID=UPI00214CA0D1|nr:winged helix-turn-helix transcriptional regulator [Ruegeria sp. YS9]UUV04871.1 winged helix-turn-helix transcriptional regulator [Ruegeria sp. YS9]
MDINTLVKLTSRAWSLKILALLHAKVPGRQAPLLAATDASRTAFAASLSHLIELGMIERNPGHGHPLRPEFRLTPFGTQAATVASKIINTARSEDEIKLLRKSWTVPVLALAGTPHRFSAIKSGLAVITDRALSSSLHQLEAQNWIRRDIYTAERMPFPTYQAVNTGMAINRAVGLTH